MHETLKQGPLRPIADIAERRTGHRPVRQTGWRWIHAEEPLRAVFVRGRWMTTEAAFDDFLQRRSEAQLRPRSAGSDDADDLKEAGLI